MGTVTYRVCFKLYYIIAPEWSAKYWFPIILSKTESPTFSWLASTSVYWHRPKKCKQLKHLQQRWILQIRSPVIFSAHAAVRGAILALTGNLRTLQPLEPCNLTARTDLQNFLDWQKTHGSGDRCTKPVRHNHPCNITILYRWLIHSNTIITITVLPELWGGGLTG